MSSCPYTTSHMWVLQYEIHGLEYNNNINFIQVCALDLNPKIKNELQYLNLYPTGFFQFNPHPYPSIGHNFHLKGDKPHKIWQFDDFSDKTTQELWVVKSGIVIVSCPGSFVLTFLS